MVPRIQSAATATKVGHYVKGCSGVGDGQDGCAEQEWRRWCGRGSRGAVN